MLHDLLRRCTAQLGHLYLCLAASALLQVLSVEQALALPPFASSLETSAEVEDALQPKTFQAR